MLYKKGAQESYKRGFSWRHQRMYLDKGRVLDGHLKILDRELIKIQ